MFYVLNGGCPQTLGGIHPKEMTGSVHEKTNEFILDFLKTPAARAKLKGCKATAMIFPLLVHPVSTPNENNQRLHQENLTGALPPMLSNNWL